ncbi:hypothetical protein ACP70R_024283 [Stipagrostis hirtigluma subsp. patula]
MFDVWRAVQWWEEWQLRILVLGSLTIQWFLLVAAPMRKYTVPRFFRTCIWLAYVSSDALAIYALATLFNRHAKATASNGCGGTASKGSILEILWAPILLIHLGGQEELTAYTIEDNELWTRHTVTLVSQVAVALYAFYKSWPTSSDWKLLTSAILLFIIGVISFSEKPWALNKASINRLASVSAKIQGKKQSNWGVYFDDLLFSDWYNCFTNSGDKPSGGHWYNCFKEPSGGNERKVDLSEGDRVYMILSDMSLLAAAHDLVQRGRANRMEDVLPYLGWKALKDLKRWLRGAFGFIYTRANVVVNPVYLTYHLLVVPALHIAALTLFATSDKHGYDRADVKTTYILMCFTAALDVFAVFIRQLLYGVMSKAGVPALCETMPGYNLIDAAHRRRQKDIGWLVKCATRMGCKEDYFDCKAGERHTTYKKVSRMIMGDLVDARGRDLASYRTFTVPTVGGASRERHVAEHVEAPSDEDEEFGGTEEIQRRRSKRAQVNEELQTVCGTADAEIQIVVSRRFTTEHNRPAPPSDDGQQLMQHAETCGPSVTTCWYEAMEQSPARVILPWEWQQQARGNWALREQLQEVCGPEIRRTLRGSFDRSIVIWHIATDLCLRMQADGHHDNDDLLLPSPGGCCKGMIPSFLVDIRNKNNPEATPTPTPTRGCCKGMIPSFLAGRRNENNPEATPTSLTPTRGCCKGMIPSFLADRRNKAANVEKKDEEVEDEEMEYEETEDEETKGEVEPLWKLRMKCAVAISNYMVHLLNSHPDMLLTGSRQHLVAEAMHEINSILKEVGNSGQPPSRQDINKIIKTAGRHDEAKHNEAHEVSFFHIPMACKLAKELLDLPEVTRSKVMYRVWLGMLCYSASMCRGYLHAKSLGEGGEFLSFVWLVLSLKGAKTLADKLQMPEPEPDLPEEINP